MGYGTDADREAFGVAARVYVRGGADPGRVSRFSAYVAVAVARQLERDALDDAAARIQAEHGPVDEAEVQRILARIAR